MKKNIRILTLNITIAIAATFSLFSCTDPVIIDYAPIQFSIFVTDSEGKDLLDPENLNNYAQGLKFNYNGTIYDVDDYLEEIRTKAYMPHFYGLKLLKNTGRYGKYQGRYYLYFGEFDGATHFNGTFRITWRDNSVDVIDINGGSGNKGKYKLNGKTFKTTHPSYLIEISK